jgi:hypothetical protein
MNANSHDRPVCFESLEARRLLSVAPGASSRPTRAPQPAPVAVLLAASTVTQPNTMDEQIIVQFTDRVKIRTGGIGTRNLSVSGGLRVTGETFTSNAAGTSVIATYHVSGPSGGWRSANDNANYSFVISGVVDASNRKMPPLRGNFSVAIQASAPMIVDFSAPTVMVGASSEQVVVTYEAGFGVDTSSIANGNIACSDPSVHVNGVTFVVSRGGTRVAATYTLVPGGGAFAKASRVGISTGSAAVRDSLGTPMAAGNAVGSFTVVSEPAADGASTGWVDESANPLFGPGGPTPDDVRQGAVGDCYLVATLSSIAQRDPGLIRKHIADLGGGKYAVSFTNGGRPETVTVDAELPVDWSNTPSYAHLGAGNSLWVALFEKAFVYLRSEQHGDAANYPEINAGFSSEVFTDLGINYRDFWCNGGTSAADLGREIMSDVNSGNSVTFATLPGNGPLVGGHVYSVVSASQDTAGKYTITVRNPWGYDPASGSGYVTISTDQITAQAEVVCSAKV